MCVRSVSVRSHCFPNQGERRKALNTLSVAAAHGGSLQEMMGAPTLPAALPKELKGLPLVEEEGRS